MCLLRKPLRIRQLLKGHILLSKLRFVDNLRYARYDARRIQIVIQRLAFPHEHREEQQIELTNSFGYIHQVKRAAIANRNR